MNSIPPQEIASNNPESLADGLESSSSTAYTTLMEGLFNVLMDNMASSSNIDGIVEEPEDILSNSPEEVIEVLKTYKPSNRKEAIGAKEKMTPQSSQNLITTQKGCLIIYHNNKMYRPKYYTLKDAVVAKCTHIEPNTKQCSGAVSADPDTGLVMVINECNHPSKRSEILEKLLRRKAWIERLAGVSTKRGYRKYEEASSQLGLNYISNKKTMAKYLERKSKSCAQQSSTSSSVD